MKKKEGYLGKGMVLAGGRGTWEGCKMNVVKVHDILE